jgi:ankyrin repeat protein
MGCCHAKAIIRNTSADTLLVFVKIHAEKGSFTAENLAEVNRLINNGARIQFQDQYGTTAVHIAASQGFDDLLELLLSNKPDAVNMEQKDGLTAAHLAVKGNHVRCLQILNKYKANMGMKAKDGHTPGSLAVSSGNVEVTQALTQCKASLYSTALCDAARQGNTALLEILSTQVPQYKNKRNPDGFTPLFLAARIGAYDACLILLHLGARIQKPCTDNITPLHVAAMNGHYKLLRLLVHRILTGKDAPADTEDDKETQGLIAAAKEGSTEAGKKKVSVQIRPVLCAMTKKVGETALFLAVVYSRHDCVRFLLENGCDPNIPTRDKFTFPQVGQFFKDFETEISFLFEAAIFAADLSAAIVTAGVLTGFPLPTPEMVRLAGRLVVRDNMAPKVQKAPPAHARQTPLLVAAAAGDTEVVKLLLDFGANPMFKDSNGQNALHNAALGGYVQCMKAILLALDGNPNKSKAVNQVVKNNGWTPLYAAVVSESRASVMLLLEHGAVVTTLTAAKQTVLHGCMMFITESDFGMIDTFLEKGVDINQLDEEKYTPLHRAIHAQCVVAVEYLLKKGATPLTRTKTTHRSPLFDAVSLGHEKIVDMLLERNADCHQLTSDYEGIVSAAVRSGQLTLVQKMIEHGGNVNQASYTGLTPLHFAAQDHKKYEIAKLLLQHKAVVGAKTATYMTPLLFACSIGDVPMAVLFMEHGASPFEMNRLNETTLLFASRSGNLDLVELLILKGVDINKSNDDTATPLLIAAETKNIDIMKLLLRKGAKANKRMKEKRLAFGSGKDNKLWSPIYVAALSGDSDLFTALVEAGAEINAHILTHDNETILCGAAKGGNAAIVRTVLDYFAAATIGGNYVNEQASAEVGYVYSKAQPPIVNMIEPPARLHWRNTYPGPGSVDHFKINTVNWIGPVSSPAHYSIPPIGPVNTMSSFTTIDAIGVGPVNKIQTAPKSVNTITTAPMSVNTIGVGAMSINKIQAAPMSVNTIAIAPMSVNTIEAAPASVNTIETTAPVSTIDIVPIGVPNADASTCLIRPAAIDATDTSGSSPLLEALIRGHFDAARTLIRNRANPYIATTTGQCPLISACYAGSLEFVQAMLDLGEFPLNLELNALSREEMFAPFVFSPDVPKMTTTMLIAAICSKNVELVTYMLDKGANPYAADHDHNTPLHKAVLCGMPDHVVRRIVDFGVERLVSDFALDPTRKEALCVDDVRRLYLNATTCLKETALHLSASKGNVPQVEYLMNEGASVGEKTLLGETVLHFAVEAKMLGVIETIVLRCPRLLSETTNKGESPLYVGARTGSWGVVELLLRLGSADTHKVTNFGQNIVFGAVEGGNPLIVEYFRRARVSTIAVDENGNSVLHVCKNPLVMQSIIQDVRHLLNSHNKDGDTPLILACRQGRIEAVRALISDLGCDLNKTDFRGESPLNFAGAASHPSIVKLLIDSGRVDVNAGFVKEHRITDLKSLRLLKDARSIYDHLLAKWIRMDAALEAVDAAAKAYEMAYVAIKLMSVQGSLGKALWDRLNDAAQGTINDVKAIVGGTTDLNSTTGVALDLTVGRRFTDVRDLMEDFDSATSVKSSAEECINLSKRIAYAGADCKLASGEGAVLLALAGVMHTHRAEMEEEAQRAAQAEEVAMKRGLGENAPKMEAMVKKLSEKNEKELHESKESMIAHLRSCPDSNA